MFNSNYSDQINKAANIIDAGGVVIIPTDTLYGLAASALIPDAIDKVFNIKKRPKTQPLPILIPDNDYIYEYTKHIPELALKITQEFWPGPLTVILEKNPKIPNNLTAGSKYVAIRIPNEEVVRSICRKLQSPITGTSANISGEEEHTKFQNITITTHELVNLSIKKDEAIQGQSSTILSFSDPENPKILREGSIKKLSIEKTLGIKLIDS